MSTSFFPSDILRQRTPPIGMSHTFDSAENVVPITYAKETKTCGRDLRELETLTKTRRKNAISNSRHH